MAVVDPYVSRFGPRVGLGPLAGWLGDPAKFDFKLQSNCAYFLPFTDGWNNSYLIVIRAVDKPIYDRVGLAKRQFKGSLDALNLYTKIENDTIKVSGGIGKSPADFNPIFYPYYYLTPASGKMMFHTSDLKERIAKQEDIQYQRIFIGLSYGKTNVLAYVHPIFRIGYIAGFPGAICGGDCEADEALLTILAAGEIAVGVVFAQPNLILGGAKLALDTWANYAAELAGYEARGKKLDPLIAASYQLGGCSGGVPPRRDWVDSIKEFFHG